MMDKTRCVYVKVTCQLRLIFQEKENRLSFERGRSRISPTPVLHCTSNSTGQGPVLQQFTAQI